MHKTIKDALTKYMLTMHTSVRYMLTGRNNQDVHVFIGMVLFLIIAYYVGA